MSKPHLVIVGSGWGGFTVLRTVSSKLYNITLISPRSYFVFTPLLAGTAVGTLEFRCALESIRKSATCEFHEARVHAIDFQSKSLRCLPAIQSRHVAPEPASPPLSFDVGYDKLVLTPGCWNNTFNVPGVTEHALFLKDVKDAKLIRERILRCFEQAALPSTPPTELKRLVTFCIVGGGPTGVEFAAELHDLVKQDLGKLYPALLPFVKIEIYDIAEKILSSFDEKLASYAQKRFKRDGIDIYTKRSPSKVEQHAMHFSDGSVKPYGLLVWSTGLMMAPLTESITYLAKHTRTKALITNDYLQVRDTQGQTLRDVYALGDCATEESVTRAATAQVAAQKGQYLGKALNHLAFNKEIKPFKFHNRGMMAFIGSGAAIVQGGRKTQLSGRAAYFLWKTAYLTMTVSLRNKILILLYWIMNAVLGRDINRF